MVQWWTIDMCVTYQKFSIIYYLFLFLFILFIIFTPELLNCPIASCPITTIIMVAPRKITANKHLTLTANSDHEFQSPIYHVKRPKDMTINIQRGCPTSRASIGQPRSPSEVSMNSGSLLVSQTLFGP